MEGPIAALRSLPRLAVHPLAIVVDYEEPGVRVEWLTIDGTEVVPHVAGRIHAVLDLVHTLERGVLVYADSLGAAIVPSDAGGPEVLPLRQGDKLVCTVTPGVLHVDIERAVVIDVAVGESELVMKSAGEVGVDWGV